MSNEADLQALLTGKVALFKRATANSQLDLSRVDFTKQPTQFLGLSDFRFPGSVDFSGCTFLDKTSFYGCEFGAGATFDDATFTGDASITSHSGRLPTFRRLRCNGHFTFGPGTRMEGTLHFGHACLGTGLTIQNAGHGELILDCNGCRVESESKFEIAGLLSVDLSGSRFARATFIRGSTKGTADFNASRFLGETLIEGFAFGGTCSFADCTFESEVSFRDAQFRRGSDFRKCTFAAAADFGCEAKTEHPISRINFSGSTFAGLLDFENREFGGSALFVDCRFLTAPSFHNCKLHQDTDFTGSDFRGETQPGAERRFRTLKLAMSQQQAHSEEMMFFAKEMRARESSEKRKSVRLLYALYRWSSSYGQSVRRPMLVLVGSVVFGAVVAWFLSKGAPWYGHDVDFRAISNILVLSTAQSLPVVPLFRDVSKPAVESLFGAAPDWRFTFYTAWALLQALASIAALFLLALGVRNLFRLK